MVQAQWMLSSLKLAHERLFSIAEYRLKIDLPVVASEVLIPGIDAFGEMALKLTLNILTTGSFIRLGKVYRSRMIDLRVSNLKLYRRAISIVAVCSLNVH
jgi:N-acetylmuramic acid 6-phosphate (MurNAc-6-P) etherase